LADHYQAGERVGELVECRSIGQGNGQAWFAGGVLFHAFEQARAQGAEKPV
jgi:hypothetical protein